VIGAAAGCLEICGEVISTTGVEDANSALEAICTSVGGVQERQLARQLTAAALNCVISGTGAGCAGTDIESLLAGCNQTCETGVPVNGLDVDDCINAVDCFNNGNTIVDGACVATDDSCHDEDVCNEELGLCFPDPGPATSAKTCNDARKSDCEVIETDPNDTGNENDCTSGLKQPEESCPQGNAITSSSGSTAAKQRRERSRHH